MENTENKENKENNEKNMKTLSPEEQLLYYSSNGNIHKIHALLSSFNIDINYQNQKVMLFCFVENKN